MKEPRQHTVQGEMFPRQYTVQECREMFLAHARGLCKYWATAEMESHPFDDLIGRIQGAVFSVLATIDGCSPGIPAMLLIPDPHPDDREYLTQLGSNFWLESDVDTDYDLTGDLHGEFIRGCSDASG